MSDNELVKHVEAAYKALSNKEMPWAHKIREVIGEILIIIVAVTLTIWFHNWSESWKEKREVRDFLTGLREDVRADSTNAVEARTFYVHALMHYAYLFKVSGGQQPNQDSLRKAFSVFFSSTTLDPHTSRYEGFKASGKFDLIHNQDLLDDIIQLHETVIKRVELLDGYYSDHINRLGTYVEQHGQLSTDGTTIENSEALLRTSEMRFLLIYGTDFINGNQMSAHDTCLARCHELIHRIDKELD